MYIFICKDSLEGILSGVYDACSSGLGHKNITLVSKEPDNFELFAEYISVEPSIEKTRKVVHILTTRFGQEFYESVYQAAMSREQPGKSGMDKANAIYQVILMALSCGNGQKVLLALGEPSVFRIFELCRATNREGHHLLGFLRFSELANGILFATIHPKNNVLPFLADHFSDRFPTENFMIYDETRDTVAIHRSHASYFLADAVDLDMERIKKYSSKELEYRNLWLTFFNTIGIDARKNPKLQMQMIPKRYWADTPEFAGRC